MRCALNMLIAAITAVAVFVTVRAEAKIYLDITSPRQQIIIGVQDLDGYGGADIAEIVSADLEFTGFFVPVQKEAFIELPSQEFDPQNWSPIGAELVLKGNVRMSAENLSVVISLYDVFNGQRIFKKLYRASPDLKRPLAHSIANDIYKQVTGQEGVFRSKIAFVAKREGFDELYIMDWDGKRGRSLGIKSPSLISIHWSGNGERILYSAQRKRRWGLYILDLPTGREERVFASQGTNIAGDFFPNGDEFVFSSSKEGTPDIFVYNLKGKQLLRVTRDRGIEVSPTVSPNGDRIAFVSDRGGTPQIYTTDKIGYNMTRITYNGSYNTSPVWSPKGDMLAFSGRHEGKNQIFLVKPDGSGLRMLTDSGNNEEPSFSPDGRFITFKSDRDGNRGIYIMRANGEAQRKITSWSIQAYSPRWSPK